jgi:antitoxin component YwqK of YwqJK toxin-antitoxin module
MKWLCMTMLLLLLTSCDQQRADRKIAHNIGKTDPQLRFDHGYYYYENILLTGTITERRSDSSIAQLTTYEDGKEQGWQTMYDVTGKVAEKRYYTKGQKDGIHTGWWPNGNLRFSYRYTKGIYNGVYQEWYENGSPSKTIYYANGNDDSGKAWRDNGKLYMNFVKKDGRRYGLNNSNLCYTIRKDTALLSASVENK